LLRNGVLVLVVFLVGCGSSSNKESDQINLSNSDLSGTWRVSTIEDIHHSESGEYLYSSLSTNTLIISDSDSETTYTECHDYGRDRGKPAIKTDENLYIDFGETRLEAVSSTMLTTEREEGIENSWLPNRYVNKRLELEKISDDVILDNGVLTMNGPISATEFSQVCLYHYYSSLTDDHSYNIIIPFEEDELDLSIRLIGQPEEQTYDFTRYQDGAAILRFDFGSTSSAFEEVIGARHIQVESAEITITESNHNVLSGSYAFVGPNDEAFDGEFQIKLSN